MEWFFSMITLNAVLAPVSIFALVYVKRNRKTSSMWAMLLWFSHSAIFWAYVFLANFSEGYSGPTSIITAWGALIDFQAYATIIGMAIVEYRLKERPTISK
jgi:hypothetical protein